jgi:peptide/nickel transport system substrate-binding protein
MTQQRSGGRFLVRVLALVGAAALAALSPPAPVASASGLTVTDAADITSLDPHRGVNGPTISLINHIYEPLVLRTREGLRPVLATRWEVSADGRTYTFFLREGVKFHDGTPFDASAVKVNFDRVISAPMKGTIGNNYLNMIKETVVVNPTTVRIVLDKPFGAFLAHLGHPSVGHLASPAAVEKQGWDAMTHRPVGTGPFRFVEWARGERVVLQRFDGYWGPKPQIERLVYRHVGEAATRVAMVETGEAQLALNVPVEDVARLERNDKLQIVKATSVVTAHIWINTRRKPFDDRRVRQALNHAVDKRRIVASIFGGSAIPVNSPVAPEVFGHAAQGVYEYDPDKARQLLAAAGVKPGHKLTLDSDRTTPKIAEVITAVAEMLKQVGLDVETRFAGDYAMYLQTRDKRDYDLAFFAWGPFSLDADAVFFPLYHSSLVGKKFNFADYANPEVDRLIEQARASTDQKERARIYAQLQTMVFRDAPAIYLQWPVTNHAAIKPLQGVWIDPRVLYWLHEARVQ